ncbi:MAG: hypothetical protein R3Y43_08095 [Alphaproteobacteria bacterium]
MQKFFQVNNSHLFSNNDICYVIINPNVPTQFPSSYEEYKNNKSAYPNINPELSSYSSDFIQKEHTFSPEGFRNELSIPVETDLENVILKSDDIIINDDEIEEELKEAGYIFERDVNEYIIKKDENNQYAIYSKDGKKTNATKTLGGHNPYQNIIKVASTIIALDKTLLDDTSQELKDFIEKQKHIIPSELEAKAIFIHEKKHAFNAVAEKNHENENLANNKPKNSCSTAETGFLNRADEISARREEFFVYAKEYRKRGYPEDLSDFDDIFRSYVKIHKIKDKETEDKDKQLSNINHINNHVLNYWVRCNSAAYSAFSGSQVLKSIENHVLFTPAFDIETDSDDYNKRLDIYFSVNIGKKRQPLVPKELKEVMPWRDSMILAQSNMTESRKLIPLKEKLKKLGIDEETLKQARKIAKRSKIKNTSKTKGLTL